MNTVDIFLTYISHSSIITLIVLGWLSLYFICSFAILLSRSISLALWTRREKASLDTMLMGAKNVRNDSILKKCCPSALNVNPKLLDVCVGMAERNATIGLSWLSIIASTSPFIGLFGTVVSILETFSTLGQGTSASLGIIAPAIGEALVATACGIFVAIPAYTFHSIIRRKGYLAVNLVQRQADIIKAGIFKKELTKQEDK